jgi:hypothetical protein
MAGWWVRGFSGGWLSATDAKIETRAATAAVSRALDEGARWLW